MGLSSDLSSYEDMRQYLDQALEAPRGIKITCQTYGHAVHQRQRMYKFRALERKASLDVYEVGDPMRGHSVYDHLVATVSGNELIIKQGTPLKVEQL